MPEGLVPPRWDRAGVSRPIRSVLCSMRFTGRPRPIPGGGSTRCMTRSAAGTCCGARGRRCAVITAHRGIDKVTLAAVEEYGIDRLLGELAAELREGRYRPLPARRVCIPKPGSGEQRPLPIPPVRDRIVQAAVKIVLGPVFEADFLPVSFGFRPRRSAHDALQVLIDECWRGRRWVAGTDIASCFSAIPHDKLMQAVQERICDQSVLKLLRVILRAGVMEGGQLRRPVTGTPQGGVVSPVLCNVYLHRLDRAWDEQDGVLVRYAGDATVMCWSRSQAERALERLTGLLAGLGLEPKAAKTRIVCVPRAQRERFACR